MLHSPNQSLNSRTLNQLFKDILVSIKLCDNTNLHLKFIMVSKDILELMGKELEISKSKNEINIIQKYFAVINNEELHIKYIDSNFPEITQTYHLQKMDSKADTFLLVIKP